MNEFNDVIVRFKKNNKILFSKEDEFLKPLMQLINQSTKKVAVEFSLEMADRCVDRFNLQFPHEKRPENTVNLSRQWAHGLIKMSKAKQAILACHQLAKEIEDQSMIALLHAIGQGCSSVHVKSHATGLIVYELSSIVFDHGIDAFKNPVMDKINEYTKRLLYWNKNIDTVNHPWASFLQKEQEVIR